MLTTAVSLLERLHQPNQPQAWNRFVQLYTPLLCAWARRLGLQHNDALDLVQDVLTHLLRELPRFQYDSGKSFRGWLHVVLVNVWRNRKQNRTTSLPDAVADGLAVPDPNADFAEGEYRQHLVARALQIMRTDFQPVTWKACWEYLVCDRPPEEVAAELQISVNAVYLARSRVLARLRQELVGLLD